MRVLVTGATGLVGANLVRALLQNGRAVRVLLRPDSNTAALDDLPVERAFGDVLDHASVRLATAKCVYVYHCAAPFAYWGQDMKELGRVAVEGTRNVVRSAREANARRMVLTASSVVFGSGAGPVARDELDKVESAEPVSAYMAAKLAQWGEARRVAKRVGLALVTVCPTITVGPHDHRLSPSNAMIVNYLNDPLRVSFPGGINVVAAADVARGHVLAAERGRPGASYILGGENLEWRELHRTIAQLVGLPEPALMATRVTSYAAATAWELYARITGKRPSVTRDEARMVGRYYWYGHEAAARLGYRPRAARAALTDALSWLIASPHVSAATRRTLRVAADVYAARSGWADHRGRGINR